MTDAANLLRSYNTALHEARTPRELTLVRRVFSIALPGTDDTYGQFELIRRRHEARIACKGSPAECDEALARALREIGGTNG
jgi:hypothetical protein